jgi:rubrerythrin
MNLEEFLWACPDMEPGFINDLTKAINGEYTAINCYKRLIDHAPSSEEKERISEIRRDEMRHFETFSRIYSTLTGMNPNPQMTAECPDKYCDGLEAAFEDEQKTVDFYHDIADKANDPMIKAQFNRAAADEQNHAVWFSYFLMNECLNHH